MSALRRRRRERLRATVTADQMKLKEVGASARVVERVGWNSQSSEEDHTRGEV